MRKYLYLISGTMGIGKTSVCQLLKKKLNNAVFLDGDWCWDADPFQVNDETKQIVVDTHRGKNTIHIIEADGYRIAHLGDLGCQLQKKQKEQLKNLDLLLVPVGGFYTIDAKEAAELVLDICKYIFLPVKKAVLKKYLVIRKTYNRVFFLCIRQIKPIVIVCL